MNIAAVPRSFAVPMSLLACALSAPPAAAQTHIHRGTPTLDGLEGPGEWTGAEAGTAELTLPTIFGGGTSTVTFYAMSDDLYFYAAVRLPVSASPDFPAVVGMVGLSYVDSLTPCAPPLLIDDFEIYSTDNAAAFYDAFWTDCMGPAILDEDDTGSTDTGGTWAISLMSHFFELSQPLNDGDDLHDMNASVPGWIFLNLLAGASDGEGDQGVLAIVGFRMFLAPDGAIFFANFETSNLSEWTIGNP